MLIFKKIEKKYRQIQFFSRNEQGAIVIMFALLLLPILGFLGLSMDLGNLYYVDSVLGGAVDAAAIAGARAGGTSANITAQANAFFNANIPANLTSSVSAPTVTLEQSNTVVKVTATAKVNTYFLPIFGIPTLTAAQSSVALVAVQGTEVALVLDNTGSMAGSAGSSATPLYSSAACTDSSTSAMCGVVNATQQLINVLYGGNGTTTNLPDTVNGLYVGVVPFTTAVNIGPAQSGWLTAIGQKQIQNTKLYPSKATVGTPNADNTVGGAWMGCIEARAPYTTTTAPGATPTLLSSAILSTYGYPIYPSGEDATDDPPSVYPFVPYLYPSTYVHGYAYGLPLNRGLTKTSTNALGSNVKPLNPAFLGTDRGDNDYTLTTPFIPTSPYVSPATTTTYQNPSLYFGDNYNANNTADGNNGVGPNLGCPVQLLPLQTSQKIVLNTVNSMQATFRGGTMINTGVSAGWWLLSPRWQGVWQTYSPNPSPTTTTSSPSNPIPQPYGSTLKVMVIMTDGINQWYDWPLGAPGAGDTLTGAQTGDADYTGYGRLGEGRAGTSNSDNTSQGTTLNTNMTNMCTILKNNGITIYTVYFNHSGGGTNPSLTACATPNTSTTTYSYVATDNASLLAAFQNIGQSITNLRLGWAPNY